MDNDEPPKKKHIDPFIPGCLLIFAGVTAVFCGFAICVAASMRDGY